MHITDENIYELAKKTIEDIAFNEEQYEQMNHIKVCKQCFDKYSAMVGIMVAVGEEGFMLLKKNNKDSSQEKKYNYEGKLRTE